VPKIIQIGKCLLSYDRKRWAVFKDSVDDKKDKFNKILIFQLPSQSQTYLKNSFTLQLSYKNIKILFGIEYLY